MLFTSDLSFTRYRFGGKKHVGGYFSEEVSKQLRSIAFEEGSSVQNLLGEAIYMVFQSRGEPTITALQDQDMSNQFADAVTRRGERKHASELARGAKHVGGYFSEEISKRFRRIALEEDSSVQNLLGEGINMVFQSRKKPTIS